MVFGHKVIIQEVENVNGVGIKFDTGPHSWYLQAVCYKVLCPACVMDSVASICACVTLVNHRGQPPCLLHETNDKLGINASPGQTRHPCDVSVLLFPGICRSYIENQVMFDRLIYTVFVSIERSVPALKVKTVK